MVTPTANAKEEAMSIIDKVTGKAKQAAGDVLDDPATRREGLREERKGEAKEEQAQAEREAETKREEVSDLERRT
jgi:uncharacterized protein YjbJ (UPF0337 family)